MLKRIYSNMKPFLIYDIAAVGTIVVFYTICSIFYLFEDNFIFEIIIPYILFYSVFIILFIRLGYTEKIKNIRAGMVLFELKLLAYPIFYMAYMATSDELPILSPLSLGNIMYGELKPITHMISNVNYNALICLPDLLLSLILPIVSFYIGSLVKQKALDYSKA